MPNKLRGVGVTMTEKVGEFVVTLKVGERTYVTSLTTNMDAEEVARRLRELADEI
jgi:hypothetical protein